MTEAEIFDSTDPVVNATDVHKFTIAANLYHALGVVALDAFEDRYDVFFLPKSFTPKGKKSLQKVLDSYQYVYDQKNDKPFLISVFNQYEADHGKVATIELLEWMRNAEDSPAGSLGNYLGGIKQQKVAETPARIERYYAFHELLLDRYLSTIACQDLHPDESGCKWDSVFHAKHAHDYYGTVENTWDPGDAAAAVGSTLRAKIAWENACQGSKPDEAELKLIGDWIIENRDFLEAEDYISPAVLYVSPILRAEYVKRELIVN